LAELGLEIELVCVNHWPVAIDTHKRNHPAARHYVQDIATVRPHLIVPEGYLDLLMASPTCTHHSVARGGKPTSDQQRSDPWHIVTWLTELRVKRIIIENVWEFCGWGPVDPRTGKPIKSRKGEYFRAWIDTIRRLGFEPEWRKLTAADYGDATTRQRFILMARSDGRRVQWPVPTHAKRPDGGLALFPTVKPWKPAREIIDWDIRGRSIFSRKKPLAPKTLARIYAGAVKFGWPEPFLVVLRNHMGAQSVNEPVPTVAANGTHIGLAEPVLVNMKGRSTAAGIGEPLPTQTAHAPHLFVAEPLILSQQNSGAPRSADEPLPTITTGGAGADKREGCARPMLAEPVIINGRKNNQAKAASTDPIPTLDTKGAIWLAEPLILNRHSAPRGETRAVSEPAPPPTTSGGGYLVEPFITTVAHGNDPREANPNHRRAKSIEDPLGTIHGDGSAYAVVAPFVLSRHAEGAPRSVDEPTPTQVAKQSHVLISAYYGSGSGNTCSHVEEPLPTVTAHGRFGMVVPVTHAGGEDRARSVDDPLSTITCAKRGELAFITAQHGERSGQAPRVHSVDDPAPTIAATGHIDVAQGVVTPVYDGDHYDILFRMLEPHELAAAMGFTNEDQAYEFAGTKTEQIKQIGNAVSVAKMKACVGAIMADAAPKRKPEPAQERKADAA
jgi:DNA (cytosine-5)-methyltransferase 1